MTTENVLDLPRPSLDSASLDEKISKLDHMHNPESAAEAAPGEEVTGAAGASVDVELPSSLELVVVEKTLSALDAGFQWNLSAKEKAELSSAWHPPLDGLYRSLLTWLGADPVKAGPWVGAFAVTAGVVLPRVAPKVITMIVARMRPKETPPDAPKADRSQVEDAVVVEPEANRDRAAPIEVPAVPL